MEYFSIISIAYFFNSPGSIGTGWTAFLYCPVILFNILPDFREGWHSVIFFNSSFSGIVAGQYANQIAGKMPGFMNPIQAFDPSRRFVQVNTQFLGFPVTQPFPPAARRSAIEVTLRFFDSLLQPSLLIEWVGKS